MNTWTRRAILTVVLAVLAVLAAAAFVYYASWQRYAGAQQQLEARSERLDGLVDAGSDIELQLAAARKNVTPWLHPAGDNAQNDVQQRLRELIASSGCTLVSSQVALDPAADGKLARVRLTATVSGDWAKLVRFMEALQSRTPPFWLRSVSFMREGQAANPTQSARLTLQLEAPLAPQSVSQKGQP